MTLKDIAKQAGVSISTVSRVINNKNYHCTRPETEQMIRDLVQKTGYLPSVAYKGLKTTPDSLGKRVISCLYARTDLNTQDQFFAAIERGVEKEAAASGCALGCSFSAIDVLDNIDEKFLSYSELDGIVVLGRFDEKLVKFLKGRTKNVIQVGLNVSSTQFDQVFVDGYKAAAKALNYLYTLGHRSIAYLGEVANEVRFTAFQDFMKEHDLPVDGHQVWDCIQSLQGGFAAAEKLVQSGRLPTALFCANDITAIGAMKALRQAHLSIPDDISIISIDDIEMAQFITPSLTTIRIPKTELGTMAVKLLNDRINHGHSLKLRLELPCDLIIRNSCRRIR